MDFLVFHVKNSDEEVADGTFFPCFNQRILPACFIFWGYDYSLKRPRVFKYVLNIYTVHILEIWPH